MKILIIEDEPALAQSIADYLTQTGFRCELARDYQTAHEKILLYEYAAIVLDISLPDGNGLKLLPLLKDKTPPIGTLIISAKNSLDDKISGLELGADDYLTKPFHLAELNARLKSIIRRRHQQGHSEIQFKEISLNTQTQSVKVHEQSLTLTRKEYEMLLYFILNQHRVLTKESLAEHLWGDHADAADSFDFLYAHIKNLRRKIKDAGGNDYLQTVYGVGYKFC